MTVPVLNISRTEPLHVKDAALELQQEFVTNTTPLPVSCCLLVLHSYLMIAWPGVCYFNTVTPTCLLLLLTACGMQCVTCTNSSERTSHQMRTMVNNQAQQQRVCLQVQQQRQPPSSAASSDDSLQTGGRTGEVVINAGLDAAGKGLSPAGSSPGAQTAPDKRVDSSRPHFRPQVSPATLLCE